MIKTVWLDNPPVNAVNAGIIETLWSELESLDDDVRVVVLRGRGERAFSAGADIGGFVGQGDDSGRPAGIQPAADLIEQAPVPVVAAIHGYCLGGGLEIALACDFRIANADAQLGFPEVNLGLLPGGGGTQRAPRLISRRPRSLADDVGRADRRADRRAVGARRVRRRRPRRGDRALRGAARQAVARTRSARSSGSSTTRATRARDEREVEAFAACLQSEDGQEGVAAFLEKREARWTGK